MRSPHTSRRSLSAVACLLGVLCLPRWAGASTFTVDPTQVFLTAKASSRLLTLRNQSDHPLRFQLTVFGWNQNEQGEMELAPTQDIVFFPTLLTLAPGDERKVRIGVATDFAAAEKTYRIFVEELPPPVQPEEGGVTVLTKMGIPIFLRPARAEARADIGALALNDHVLSFELNNQGTVHFVPDKVRVRGLTDSGDVVFDREMNGWYVLAGDTRRYELELPRPECTKVTSLAIDVMVAKSTLSTKLQTPPAACSP